MSARSLDRQPTVGSGSITRSATSAYSSRPSKTFARFSRKGSSSASGPGSTSKRATGTTSSMAPSRAPMTSTCDSARSTIGSAALGVLPAAISRTVRRNMRASAADSSDRRARSSDIDEPPSLEGPAQGDLVGVLEVTADREAGREAGHPQPEVPKHAGEVARGRLTLEVGVGGDDDLGDRAVPQPGEELPDAKVVGPDAVDGADGPAEHVVAPPELPGALDGDDVLGLLDDTDRVKVAARIQAHPAAVGLRHVEAHLAEAHLELDLGERVRQAFDVRGVGLEEVEGDALGALGTDTRQPAELVDEVLDRAFVHASRLRPSADRVPRRRAPDHLLCPTSLLRTLIEQGFEPEERVPGVRSQPVGSSPLATAARRSSVASQSLACIAATTRPSR